MKFLNRNGVRFGVKRGNGRGSYCWFPTLRQFRPNVRRCFLAMLLVTISLFSLSSLSHKNDHAIMLPRVAADESVAEGLNSPYNITFNPANYWECGEEVIVTFQGPLTENHYAGDQIQFQYYQYSSSDPDNLQPLWSDVRYATSGDTITYTIDPSEWGGFNYATLPNLAVIVSDTNVPSGDPYQKLWSYPTNIQPFSCSTGAGYVGYTTYANTGGGQVTTQVIATQTLGVTTTSSAYTTLVTTTTGYATTQVSTTVTSETSYVTEVVHSYGTVTATQYVYLESSNSTPNVYPASSGSTGPGTNLFNPGALGGLMSGNSISPPLLLLVGSGAAVAVLVSALLMRRRRGGRGLEKSVSPSEVDERLMDYITDHNGAISVAKASKDLGMSAEDVGEALMRLRADGKLQGG